MFQTQQVVVLMKVIGLAGIQPTSNQRLHDSRHSSFNYDKVWGQQSSKTLKQIQQVNG